MIETDGCPYMKESSADNQGEGHPNPTTPNRNWACFVRYLRIINALKKY